MIKVEPCPGCGRLIFIKDVANLKARLDSLPVDAQEATAELIAGRTVWRITETSLRPARPAELMALRNRGTVEGPRILREHRCTPGSRPPTPSPGKETDPAPKGRQGPVQPLADLSTRTSAPGMASYGVPPAETPRTDGPRCDRCSVPCRQGTYASIELGELTLWAEHINQEECGNGSQ